MLILEPRAKAICAETVLSLVLSKIISAVCRNVLKYGAATTVGLVRSAWFGMVNVALSLTIFVSCFLQ
jgi:hypothetical protein